MKQKNISRRISQRTLVRRINTALKPDWQQVKRYPAGDSEGEHFLADTMSQHVIEEIVDLLELAQKLGVLKSGETVDYSND